MKISEILQESKLVWARRGQSVRRKFRCTGGPRKGRIVASPEQCNKPVDVRKRAAMRRMKAAKGGRMARKARRTKRYNPISRRVAALNKPR